MNRKTVNTLDNGSNDDMDENGAGKDTRSAFGDEVGTSYGKTRVVERQKRPYSGFITKEQAEESREAVRINDRKTRVVEMDQSSFPGARLDDGLRGIGSKHEGEEKGDESSKARQRTIVISDSKKFKRLIAVLAAVAILLAAETGLIIMKAKAAQLPAETDRILKQTEEIREKNDALRKEAEPYGDYKDQKELSESWERLKKKLTEQEKSE